MLSAAAALVYDNYNGSYVLYSMIDPVISGPTENTTPCVIHMHDNRYRIKPKIHLIYNSEVNVSARLPQGY